MILFTKAHKFLDRITPTSASISDEERERLINYAILVCINVPTAFAFSVNALFKSQHLLFTLIFIATGMQIFGWRMIHKGMNPESVFRLNFWLFSALLLYMAHSGGEGGSKALWLYTAPLIAFGLLRTREASYASLLVGLLAILAMHTARNDMGQAIFSLAFILRLGISYLILVIVTGSFNALRHRYWREARKNHRALEAEKSRLEKEIIRRTRAEADLQQLASTDYLCDILNRRAFMQLAEKEMARHRRSKEPLCLAILDIDHFKLINDQYGHPQGDIVLQGITRRIACRIRISDHFGRIGGEEFAILLVATPLHEGMLLAERLRRCIEEQAFILSEADCPVSISIGVWPIDASKETLGDALQQADRALYLAKNKGRNRVETTFATEYSDTQQGKPIASASHPASNAIKSVDASSTHPINP